MIPTTNAGLIICTFDNIYIMGLRPPTIELLEGNNRSGPNWIKYGIHSHSLSRARRASSLPWICANISRASLPVCVCVLYYYTEYWTSAVIRIEWLHAKASTERFEEGLTLIKAESSRVGKTFRYMANQWRIRGEGWKSAVVGSNDAFERGAAASSFPREYVFLRLVVLAETSHKQLLRHDRLHL